jgi:hypothetical protein
MEAGRAAAAVVRRVRRSAMAADLTPRRPVATRIGRRGGLLLHVAYVTGLDVLDCRSRGDGTQFIRLTRPMA